MDKEARSKHLQMDRILGKKVDSRKEEGTAGKIGYFDFYPFLITKKEKKKKKIRPTPLKIEEKVKKQLSLYYQRSYSSSNQCIGDSFSLTK